MNIFVYIVYTQKLLKKIQHNSLKIDSTVSFSRQNVNWN